MEIWGEGVITNWVNRGVLVRGLWRPRGKRFNTRDKAKSLVSKIDDAEGVVREESSR